MKSLRRLILILSALLPSAISFTQYDSLLFEGYNRTYLVHLPTGYTGAEELPLVIVMHGGFGTAVSAQNKSKFSLKADSENFIVVYPEGVKGGALNISSWNAGWCCGFASSSNINDVGFIDSLLNTLIGQYAIDTSRIYASGMSNGGFMAYRLACELSDRIAAIAPVASSMSMETCSPNRPVPVIHFHSYLDSNVPYLGGIGDGFSNHYNSPQDSIMNAWSNLNNCVTIADTVVDNAEYTFTKWTNCACGTEIHHYITHDGGHSWPGGGESVVGDSVSEFINATDLIWSFFQHYSLDCATASIQEEKHEEPNLMVSPNPTKGRLKISVNSVYQTLEVSVFSVTGKKILTVYDQTEIDLSFLEEGIYFLKLNADGAFTSAKIIKID